MITNLSTHLKIPNNLDGSCFSPEQSGLFIINHVVNKLYHNYKVSYYEYSDLYQEGVLFALSGLATGAYDASKPLEKFLYIHVKNRFKNFIRDKFYRNPGPCKKCPFFDKDYSCSDNQCAAFTDKRDCDKFYSWNKDSESKKQLAGTSHESNDSNVRQKSIFYDFEFREFADYLQNALPEHLKSDFERLKVGESIPDSRRSQIASIIKDFLYEEK